MVLHKCNVPDYEAVRAQTYHLQNLLWEGSNKPANDIQPSSQIHRTGMKSERK